MHNAFSSVALMGLLAELTSAWNAPGYAGMNIVWQETFGGASGSAPNPAIWNTITDLHVNNEWQTYTTSSQNLQISGGNTVQIVPRKDASGAWTSARIESKYTFAPAAGKRTWAEADIRFGDNPIGNKQGIWPAFWMLGDSLRHGAGWPACGEVDALETVNGILTGQGTVHCDVASGGICNEPSGLWGSTGIPDQSWHTWRVQFDRSSNNWQTETITWYIDGNAFTSLSGSRIGNEAVWSTLCHNPLYFILNVAVGGNWPGPPNGATLDGYGSMMEVAYVAVYSN